MKYMKDYQQYALGSTQQIPIKPLSEEKLQELRELVNSGEKLPLAFEEFLSIGGASTRLGIGFGKGIIETQKLARENIDDSPLEINKPFVAFDENDRCTSFRFVYLDEGEDPIVYNANPYAEVDVEITSLNRTFSEFVKIQLNSIKRTGFPIY